MQRIRILSIWYNCHIDTVLQVILGALPTYGCYTESQLSFGITSLNCTGTESNLLNCSHSNPVLYNCQSHNDAGLICQRK